MMVHPNMDLFERAADYGEDGCFAVVIADYTIMRMLSGKCPPSASIEVGLVSFALAMAYKCKAKAASVAIDGRFHMIEPYKHSFAEVITAGRA